METYRIIDTKKVENQYAKHKFPNNYQYIDIEARVYFKEGVLTRMLKCCYGIIQYGNHDKLINPNKVQEYSRYSQEETWQHVV